MRFDPLPDDYVETRDALHQIAFFAISPARYQAVGRMGLEDTPGGFGTPPFEERVARVEGDLLVHEHGDGASTQGLTTVREAASFFGVEYQVQWFDDFHDPLDPKDPDARLQVDRESAHALGAWFAFGFDVLNELRGQGTPDDDVSETQLWPEHFDPATELGSQEKGRRASFGASPGDGSHQSPYLYVAPWAEFDSSADYWNADGFAGAQLGYDELIVASEPRDRALEFLLTGYRLLSDG